MDKNDGAASLVRSDALLGFPAGPERKEMMRIIDNIRKFAVNAAVHGFISRRTWARLRDRTGLKEDVRGLVRLIEEDKSGDDARLIEVVFQGLRCALAKEGYTSCKPNAQVEFSEGSEV